VSCDFLIDVALPKCRVESVVINSLLAEGFEPGMLHNLISAAKS
jgi:hypothetical protein